MIEAAIASTVLPRMACVAFRASTGNKAVAVDAFFSYAKGKETCAQLWGRGLR
jgi:hypothetical protein